MNLLLSFTSIGLVFILTTLFLTPAESATAQEPGDAKTSPQSGIQTAAFLPEGHAQDGSVSYMSELQAALDAIGRTGGTIVFAPITYLIDNPAGLQVHSNTTLRMEGARFVLPPSVTADGQAFRAENAHNIRFVGGTVVGSRDQWEPSTNVAGIRIFGESSRIRIHDIRFEDLSSNAIGLFGVDDEHPMKDVRLRDVTTRNCCNYYGDYLDEDIGPAKGSDRKDQGNVALYYVNDWVVDGCDFDGSQSDGTHFFHSHHGQFVNNRVRNSKMGGYFLEGCNYVTASDNLISQNGSRGVTIERDSRFCTLENNVVELSGREGLWGPDIMGCVISGNIFRENGRKDDTDRDSEIRLDNGEKFETETRDIQITGNLFYTTAHQGYAIQVTAQVRQVAIRGNSFRGPVEKRHIDVDTENTTAITIENNDFVGK